MRPDKSDLKLLSSNPSGLRALLEYLEATEHFEDANFTEMARSLVFTPDNRDPVIISYGRKRMCEDLIHDIESMTSIKRGEK